MLLIQFTCVIFAATISSFGRCERVHLLQIFALTLAIKEIFLKFTLFHIPKVELVFKPGCITIKLVFSDVTQGISRSFTLNEIKFVLKTVEIRTKCFQN